MSSRGGASSVVYSQWTVNYEDLPNLAIASLSNLLSANVDVGLKHCLALGYSDDPALRTAFMRVLVNVLQQGTRFGAVPSHHVSGSPQIYLDLLNSKSDNFALAIAMCDVCSPNEIEELSLLLFRVYEAKGMLLDLMKLLIEREIALTSE